jgi:hypothetical protein
MKELEIQNVNIWKSSDGHFRACVLFGKDWDCLLIRRQFSDQTLIGIWGKIEAEAQYLRRSSAENDHGKS